MTGKGNWNSGAGGGGGGAGAGLEKWTMSGIKSGPAKKGSKPRKLELDSGKVRRSARSPELSMADLHRPSRVTSSRTPLCVSRPSFASEASAND